MPKIYPSISIKTSLNAMQFQKRPYGTKKMITQQKLLQVKKTMKTRQMKYITRIRELPHHHARYSIIYINENQGTFDNKTIAHAK